MTPASSKPPAFFQYGGVAVPHFEQYTGPWAMLQDRFDQQLAMIRAVDPAEHVAETQAAIAKRRADGKPALSARDEAGLDNPAAAWQAVFNRMFPPVAVNGRAAKCA